MYSHIAATQGNIVNIEVACVSCGNPQHMQANADGYIEWRYGDKYIQEAMPELSVDDREMLISGVCGKCWNNMFKEE